MKVVGVTVVEGVNVGVTETDLVGVTVTEGVKVVDVVIVGVIDGVGVIVVVIVGVGNGVVLTFNNCNEFNNWFKLPIFTLVVAIAASFFKYKHSKTLDKTCGDIFSFVLT